MMSDGNEARNIKGAISFAICAVAALLLSQLSSFLVETNIGQNQTVVLSDLVWFTHVRNLGGIFGIMQGKGWLFAVVSLIFLSGLTYFVTTAKGIRGHEYFFYGLIVGGGGSNILDRLIYGSVIDFIDVQGIKGWNYIFNTADVFIHLGVWPLVLSTMFFQEKKKES